MLNEKDYNGPNVFFPVRKILRENRELGKQVMDMYTQIGRSQQTIDTLTKEIGHRFRHKMSDKRVLEYAKAIVKEFDDA